MEFGLPEAVKLMVGAWHHYQKLDYEQLPFKCRNCHEHGHFQRNYAKAQLEDKEEGEGWQKVKEGKTAMKPSEKKSTRPPKKPQPTPLYLRRQLRRKTQKKSTLV